MVMWTVKMVIINHDKIDGFTRESSFRQLPETIEELVYSATIHDMRVVSIHIFPWPATA